MPTILATVFQTIYYFLEQHPAATVGFKGSSASRTRLYQVAITRELDEVLQRFDVWGIKLSDNQPEPFQRNTPYQSFFIALKN